MREKVNDKHSHGKFSAWSYLPCNDASDDKRDSVVAGHAGMIAQGGGRA
jgi:hypothetical protein